MFNKKGKKGQMPPQQSITLGRPSQMQPQIIDPSQQMPDQQMQQQMPQSPLGLPIPQRQEIPQGLPMQQVPQPVQEIPQQIVEQPQESEQTLSVDDIMWSHEQRIALIEARVANIEALGFRTRNA